MRRPNLPVPSRLRRRPPGEGPARVPTPGDAMRRWREFQQQQQEALRESNRFPRPPDDGSTPFPPPAGPADPLEPQQEGPADGPDGPPQGDDRPAADAVGTAAARDAHDHQRGGAPAGGPGEYGPLGRAFNHAHPVYLGFMATMGVALAYVLVSVLRSLGTVLTVLLVAFFLTLALNPIVERLERRGAGRSWAVGLVCLGLVAVFALLSWVVVPPLVTETSSLIANAPAYVQNLTQQPWAVRLDKDYQIGQKINEQVAERASDGRLVNQVFGGVLGAGKVLANGVFQAFTVLILTLYLLASFPAVKKAAYAAVPASRRPRVISLSEEIMRRAGSYAVGQVLVASINGGCSWVMMTWLGLPYAAVLAVAVGFLGLIPMVGATLGAVIVGVVAFFVEPQKALVVAVYYLVYQQIENYVVVPRIMRRTVSVPGAVTVVAALAGGTVLGVLGALLAIPVAAGLLLLYEEVLVPRQARL